MLLDQKTKGDRLDVILVRALGGAEENKKSRGGRSDWSLRGG